MKRGVSQVTQWRYQYNILAGDCFRSKLDPAWYRICPGYQVVGLPLLHSLSSSKVGGIVDPLRHPTSWCTPHSLLHKSFLNQAIFGGQTHLTWARRLARFIQSGYGRGGRDSGCDPREQESRIHAQGKNSWRYLGIDIPGPTLGLRPEGTLLAVKPLSLT